MNLGYAMGRGMRFGANVGAIIAIAGLFAAGSAAGFGLGPVLFGPELAPVLGMVGEAIAGTLIGAASGTALFTVTHVLTHAIPGMARTVGDTTPRRGETRGRAGRAHLRERSGEPQRLAETDSRNVGFRRQIEEQRQREELEAQLQDAGMGR